MIDDASFDNNCLELGFLEKADPWHLLSYQLPSKVGGRPAWLGLENVPAPAELSCPSCHSQMAFLMQIYCPIDERDDCYHRMLYVFMCKRGACYTNADDSRPMKVFRCQLPKDNKYYGHLEQMNEEPTLDEVNELIKSGQVKLLSHFVPECAICGAFGTKTCVNCKQVSYCSKEHQVIDWKTGHKALCSDLQDGSAKLPLVNISSNSFNLREYELLLSPIPNSSSKNPPQPPEIFSSSPKQEDSMVEASLTMETIESGIDQTDDLEEFAKKETEEDKIFLKFKQDIQADPDQVARYSRGGKPLWISTKAKLDCQDLVPHCQFCGATRQFEFQVMPQLLHYLKLESDVESAGGLHVTPDWGCLYVYTCSESCSPSGMATQGSYLSEVIFRHDVR